jgi:hypothetical protein
MSEIFISYARADQEKVRPLAKALETMGLSVWWDARIRSGEAFDGVIEKALEEARCVIVVWSKKSVDSDWVRAEAGDGLERGILISISIERGLIPPLRFRNINTVIGMVKGLPLRSIRSFQNSVVMNLQKNLLLIK